MEYLSHFDFDIRYVKGVTNKVADCLLQYYENNNWDKTHDITEYINADMRLDLDHNNLPLGRMEEVEGWVIEL